ncbi:hypothetical protein [Dietzia sp. CH92]|uniref:hypothetical protein n=1 Tax=Dietzia sp. CH92 TaxID=3051823 RepID=UPI0028D7EEB3|nr:hypothetical protein [Dietzia sp. CH92]
MTRESAAGFADQAASSLANILVIFACARVMDVASFGEASVAFAIVTAIIMGCRGFLGTSLAVLSGDHDRVKSELDRASGAALLLGFFIGLILVLYGAWSDSSIWIVFGLGCPFLAAQDVIRYGAISLSRSTLALTSDLVRLVVSIVCFASTFTSHHQFPPVAIVGSWPAGAVLSVLVVCFVLKVRPSPRSFIVLMADRLRERLGYAFDTLMMSVTSILYIVILTSLLGNEGVAGLRGAGTLLGPLNTMVAGLSLVMVPRLARSKASVSAMIREVIPLTTAMCVVAGLCGSLGFWLPESLGSALLGPTWVAAAIVLPIMAVEYALTAIRTSLSTILRARRAASRLVVARIASTVGMLTVAAVGPLFGGPEAVAWGMVMNSAVGVTIVAVLLTSLSRGQRPLK